MWPFLGKTLEKAKAETALAGPGTSLATAQANQAWHCQAAHTRRGLEYRTCCPFLRELMRVPRTRVNPERGDGACPGKRCHLLSTLFIWL